MTNRHTPLISVLLPVYNAGNYLHEAMQTTLGQTLGDFEIIVIDDGSTDHSVEIIQSYTHDSRVRFCQQANQGLAATLNRAASLAQGLYLARQDQDDRSMPERFARQVAFLESSPDVWLVGTATEIWEEENRTERLHRHPTDPAELAFQLLFDNYFVHSSVMFRREVIETVGLYCTERERQPEDFELWSRVARAHRVANLSEVLHVYRERSGSMCRTGVHPYRDRVVRLSSENIAWACGAAKPEPEHQAVAALIHRGTLTEGYAPSSRSLRQTLDTAAAGIARRHGVAPEALATFVNDRHHCAVHNLDSGGQDRPRKLARRLAGKLTGTLRRIGF